MRVPMLTFMFMAARFDAGGRHHHLALVAGRLQQTLLPAFETEAVDHHQPGARDAYRVLRRGVEHMGVGVRPHQGSHGDALATHHFHQVGQDAEAGHHRQFFGRRTLWQQQGQAQGHGGQHGTFVQSEHGVSKVKNQLRARRSAASAPCGDSSREPPYSKPAQTMIAGPDGRAA